LEAVSPPQLFMLLSPDEVWTEAELVKFSSLGTHFAVLFPKKIEIYSLALKLLHTLTTTSRFNSLLFTYRPSSSSSESSMEETELLCVGTEKGVVEVYRIDVPSEEIAEEPTEDGVEGGQTGSGAEVALLGHLIGHTNR